MIYINLIFNPLLHRLFFLFLDNIEKITQKLKLSLNTFENIKESGTFARKEQMFHFSEFFQIHDISKASKGVIVE